jgi:hypothetical protein
MLVAAHMRKELDSPSPGDMNRALPAATARTTAPGPFTPCGVREPNLQGADMTDSNTRIMHELTQAHELLTDAGIPRHDDNSIPISLPVRVGLLIDESNSVRAELHEIIDSIAP